jgi:hypothetical protein
VGPRAGLDAMEKRKSSLPGLERRFLDRPDRSPVAIPTELSRFLNHLNYNVYCGCYKPDDNYVIAVMKAQILSDVLKFLVNTELLKYN